MGFRGVFAFFAFFGAGIGKEISPVLDCGNGHEGVFAFFAFFGAGDEIHTARNCRRGAGGGQGLSSSVSYRSQPKETPPAKPVT